VRAGLIRAAPALSYHFGVHPWHYELLSVVELNEYLVQLDALAGDGDE